MQVLPACVLPIMKKLSYVCSLRDFDCLHVCTCQAPIHHFKFFCLPSCLFQDVFFNSRFMVCMKNSRVHVGVYSLCIDGGGDFRSMYVRRVGIDGGEGCKRRWLVCHIMYSPLPSFCMGYIQVYHLFYCVLI